MAESATHPLDLRHATPESDSDVPPIPGGLGTKKKKRRAIDDEDQASAGFASPSSLNTTTSALPVIHLSRHSREAAGRRSLERHKVVNSRLRGELDFSLLVSELFAYGYKS